MKHISIKFRLNHLGQKILIIIFVFMLTVSAGEFLRRVLDGYNLFNLQLTKNNLVEPTSKTMTRDALKVLAESLIVKGGPDISYFEQDPEKQDMQKIPALLQRRADGSPISRYHVNFVYNDKFLQTTEGRNYIKKDYPESIFSFSAPKGSVYPRYRHYPSAQLTLGLKMNSHGWRSEEISLNKPSKTIRIAALGDSTTLHQGSIKISYLDYLKSWLERWSKKHGYDYKIEILNTGRESISSEDVRAILTYEVMPFEPDYVLFYGLGNQWDIYPFVDFIDPVKRGPEGANAYYKKAYFSEHLSNLLRPISDYSASALWAIQRMQTNIGEDGREPRKPVQEWHFPNSLSERTPDPGNLFRNTGVKRMVRDLDAVVNSLKSTESRFFMQTFKFLAHEGLILPQPESQGIFNYLNYSYFPYSYKNIERAINYMNRIYINWASDRGIPITDIAGNMPSDYRLFVDGMHNSQSGVKIRAWILFQNFLPYFAADIKAGKLPVPDKIPMKEHPFPLKVISIPIKDIISSP